MQYLTASVPAQGSQLERRNDSVVVDTALSLGSAAFEGGLALGGQVSCACRSATADILSTHLGPS
jgi:hypothetical protein